MLEHLSPYKTKAQRAFQDYAKAQGWKITKQGWPDFNVSLSRPLGRSSSVPRGDRYRQASPAVVRLSRRSSSG